jgi:thioredoxin-related protein
MKYLLIIFLFLISCNSNNSENKNLEMDSVIIFLDTIPTQTTTNLDSLNRILDSIEYRIPKIREKKILYAQTNDSLNKVRLEMKIKEKKLREKEIECLIYLSREQYNSAKSIDTFLTDTNSLN